MAGTGGKDDTSTSSNENYSVDISDAGKKLLKCFTNLRIGTVCVNGYKGVGRWRIVQYAAQMLNESHPFDVQILVKLHGRDFSVERVQMEIESQLKLTANVSPGNDENLDGTKFSLAAANIRESLIKPKFLLIIGVVTEDIDLENMGIPLWSSKKESKVILVSDGKKQICDATINLEKLSINMLREEATEVALSPCFMGFFTPKAVLDCCLYLWFFFRERFEGHSEKFDVKRLIRNWIAEGFITRRGKKEDEEEDQTLEEKAYALFRELEHRSLVALATCKEGSEPLYCHLNDVPESDLTCSGYLVEEPEKMKYPKLTTLHIMGNNRFTIPESYFEQMQGLRVLHLYCVCNVSLPSIACLLNLRLLRIHHLKRLESLSSFQNLHNLEFLEVSESSFSESMLHECFQQMTNLRFLLLDNIDIKCLPPSVSKMRTLRQLILTNSKSLTEIPEVSFEYMQQLQVVDLSGDSKLKSLPDSLFKSINLRRLILSNCSSLNMLLLPHLQKLSGLEELDLCCCNSLKDIKDVASSCGNTLGKLRKLHLSEIDAIERVCLIDCPSLESVSLNSLQNLQHLRIWGTKIKSFPENMHGTHHLKRLDMLSMNHICEIKWDALSNELEDLNIDQCCTLNSLVDNDESLEKKGGSRIWLNNLSLLQSLTPSSEVWIKKCFSKVYICISACQEDEIRRKIVYANDLPPASHFNKHLEIQGGNTLLNSIDGVLSQMELFTLSNNASVQRLSALVELNKLNGLKEYRVQSCERMEIVFEGESADSDALRHLEKIWMSNLASLRSVSEATDGSFQFLKHIYLEYCPTVTFVFSSGICLQSLETLQIKFCNKLEKVFQGDATAQDSLQLLHTVCLWELPMLESICSGVCLPALKKLIVSGCEKLKKLPLRVPPANVAASNAIGRGSVEVEGDEVWWDSLKLVGESIEHHVHFKERRPFTMC